MNLQIWNRLFEGVKFNGKKGQVGVSGEEEKGCG